MGKLFGTDGIRGMANEYPVTSEVATRLGQSVARFFQREQGGTKILIGKDTRISGDMLEQALISGVCSTGAGALLAGVLPTPGVAAVTRRLGLDGGLVISASHNPYHDNGIKVIQGNGFKLSDEAELAIERSILELTGSSTSVGPETAGRPEPFPLARADYMSFLTTSVFENEALEGIQVVLDCGNGATYEVAPAVFSELGATVQTLFADPDGKNINLNCGSEHPQALARKVVQVGAVAGFAFDGDGDRVIAVDERGEIVTGDQMLIICAKALKDENRLRNNMAVSTVMSNMGLGLGLKKLGIEHVMTRVGDRFVVQEMLARGACLGGEDSGHMVFLEHHTTGDGILTALWLLRAMKRARQPLSELKTLMQVYPQLLVNIEVRHKPAIDTVPEIVGAIGLVERTLGDKGRVFVRYSGTQSMCRVMVEAPTQEACEKYCDQIAAVVREKLA
jgi:phosphoglucosamine mutase